MSGAPQGFGLGAVLFITSIKDIDIRLSSFISKFAVDTKIGNSIINDRDKLSLQVDLRKISEWPER